MPNTSRQWFRMYAEFASDPKVQMMPEHMQRRLAMLFCLRCHQDTKDLSDEQIGFHMRITPEEAGRTRELFHANGFTNSNGWGVKNWHKRQRKSDVNTSTERVKRWNQRHTCPNCKFKANSVIVKTNGKLEYCPFCTDN